MTLPNEYLKINKPMLKGFLSDHSSDDKVVSIIAEPEIIYFEKARDSLNLHFDFVIKGLTERNLIIKFIKVAVFDENHNLITFRHLNHNGVGTPSIHTIGKFEINGQEAIDVFNPFHNFSKEMKIDHLRYMFTFTDKVTKEEFYYGNIPVKPTFFHQKAKLHLPLQGLLIIIDGHDFYSHHRRFGMTIVRNVTAGKFASNFSRFAVDFTLVGPDGNLQELKPDELKNNYDFHFSDVKKFYTHGIDVFAPADGDVVDVVSHLEDLYSEPFSMDKAIQENSIKDIAGNYIIIQHNNQEFSHLFHLLKNSIAVKVGQKVKQGEKIAQIGFSGAATTYSHLHYQLMDGRNFLEDNPLPCEFSNVVIIQGSTERRYKETILDTGDFVRTN